MLTRNLVSSEARPERAFPIRKRKTPWPFLYSVHEGVIHQNRTPKTRSRTVGNVDWEDAPF